MTTDEQLEARLSRAGARWRAEHGSPVRVDPADLAGASASSRGRWPAAAAGVAAVLIAVLVVALVRPGGGSSAPSTAAGSLVGTWQLTRAQPSGAAASTPASGASFAVDRTGHVSGSDGCNHFDGPATIRGNHLDLGQVASTAIGCLGGDSGAIDLILFGGAPLSWSVAGDQLTLTSSAGTLTGRRPPPAGEPLSIVGYSWTLLGVQTAAGGSTSLSTAEPGELRLYADNRFDYRWAASCSPVYEGAVTVASGSAVLSDVTTEGWTCASSVPHSTSVTGDMFSRAGRVTWMLAGSQLTITRSDVAGALVFTRGSAIPASAEPTPSGTGQTS